MLESKLQKQTRGILNRSENIPIERNYRKVLSRSGWALFSSVLLHGLNSSVIPCPTAHQRSATRSVLIMLMHLYYHADVFGRKKTLFLLPDSQVDVNSSPGPFEPTEYDLEIRTIIVIKRTVLQRATFVKRYLHYYQSAVKQDEEALSSVSRDAVRCLTGVG